MNITVIGSGYVGTTTALVLAKLGHQVIGYDVDASKVERLNRGELPFREPGLEELLHELLQDGKIVFTADGRTAVTSSQLLMISVGTPSAADGNADLKYLTSAIDTIAEFIDGPKIVITKSTVPIGTNRWIKERFAEKVDLTKTPVDVVSNPEFLREGSALHDSFQPSRTIVGGDNPLAVETVKRLYSGLPTTYYTCDFETAEMIKYASNGFLAAKISFINEIARLAEEVGADIGGVARGMGMDPRISSHHLSAGIGYGGSCFPKDVAELLHLANRKNVKLSMLAEAKRVNDTQIDWFVERMQAVAPLKGQRVLVLGVAFKEDTDDQRESPGIRLMERLLKLGVREVRAFDPTVRAVDEIRWTKPLGKGAAKRVKVATDVERAADGVHAVVLTTPWKSFETLPWKQWATAAATPVVFDGRNFLDDVALRGLGWQYYGVARGRGR
ncbi:UDP-glucose dehydrogenase family protein [Paenibacillus antri]|uniref:UDP-glucose dehydrogenase family protein n=1 Tax=Paenibacillus antri TaxID=2582848 RepID=UPI0013052F8B|nr:UDP-glucose/GDP-mannose dehydrogenase family protein [Paenibacillus antri]